MLPADQMANPLGDTALTPAELLMREAIQNSVDEKLKNSSGSVKIVVKRLNLKGEEKRSFVKALHLAEFRERAKVCPDRERWFRIRDTCLPLLDDPDVGLPILVLSDHNTNGLGGQWNKNLGAQSRFHNLKHFAFDLNRKGIPLNTIT